MAQESHSRNALIAWGMCVNYINSEWLTIKIFLPVRDDLDVNSEDDTVHTAQLHFAIQNGNTSIIEQLEKYGADVYEMPW